MVRRIVTDVEWGGLRSELVLGWNNHGVLALWRGDLPPLAGRLGSDLVPGARRVQGLVGVTLGDCLLAANGAHGLGLINEGTWLTTSVLDRLSSAELRRRVFPEPRRPPAGADGEDEPTAVVSVPIAAAVVERQPLFAPLTDGELSMSILRTNWPELGADRVSSRDSELIDLVQRYRLSVGRSDCRWPLDALPFRHGYLPGRRPWLRRQGAWARRDVRWPSDPALIAALGLSKAHELAWAAGIVDAAEVADAPDLDTRLASAFADAGVTHGALVQRLVDELVLPATVGRALESLTPTAPPAYFEQPPDPGTDPFDHFPDLIEHLVTEQHLRWWRIRGAMLRCFDAGLPAKLGTGVFLFRRPTTERLRSIVDLAERGVGDWATLVDLRAAGVGAAEIDALRSRGIAHPDAWLIAHRATVRRGSPAATYVRPATLAAHDIEARIDELSLARLWEECRTGLSLPPRQRQLRSRVAHISDILRLHASGLTGRDVERFRNLGITDVNQMTRLAHLGVDGCVASILNGDGHRHPDRWPRLSPYGAVRLDDWLGTFAVRQPPPERWSAT